MYSHKEDLEHAINKWINNCESSKIIISWKFCTLCLKYINLDTMCDDEFSCDGCPIFEWINKQYCTGTPYNMACLMYRTGINPTIDPCVREVHFLQNILSLEENPNVRSIFQP